jgi:hypothetical protein
MLRRAFSFYQRALIIYSKAAKTYVVCDSKMSGPNGYGYSNGTSSTRYTLTALNRWSVADKEQLPGMLHDHSAIMS